MYNGVTKDGYIELGAYSQKKYNAVSEEVKRYNEAIHTDTRAKRDDIAIFREDIMRYWNDGRNNTWDSSHGRRQPNSDGQSGGIYREQSSSDRIADNESGVDGASVKFSREIDSDYLAAVNRREMETAQKVVDEEVIKSGTVRSREDFNRRLKAVQSKIRTNSSNSGSSTNAGTTDGNVRLSGNSGKQSSEFRGDISDSGKDSGVKLSREINENRLRGRWSLLEKTEYGYIELRAYSYIGYDLVEKEVNDHNENIRGRTDERLYSDFVRYGTIEGYDTRNMRNAMGKQAGDGQSSRIHKKQSASYRSPDNKSGLDGASVKSSREINENHLRGRWSLLEKTKDVYIELGAYSYVGYDLVEKEVDKHNEDIRGRTDEQIYRGVMLYEAFGEYNTRDMRNAMGKQASTGQGSGLYKAQPSSDGSPDNKSGLDGSAIKLSREIDADYLAAVKRGDMETAQKMVDEEVVKSGTVRSREDFNRRLKAVQSKIRTNSSNSGSSTNTGTTDGNVRLSGNSGKQSSELRGDISDSGKDIGVKLSREINKNHLRGRWFLRRES